MQTFGRPIGTLNVKHLVLVELRGLAGGEWRGGVVVFAVRTACCIALVAFAVMSLEAFRVFRVQIHANVTADPVFGGNELEFKTFD